jgi:NAD(P)-dependent dehydrogenase (short-subunit alcohol dehydrogenase family)
MLKVMTRAINILSEEDIKALFRDIKNKYGMADILISNAGSGKYPLPIKDVDPKDFWYDFVSIDLAVERRTELTCT